VLARREAEVGGEVAARAEAVDVADQGDEGGGREDAHPRDSEQELDVGHLRGQPDQLGPDRLGPTVVYPSSATVLGIEYRLRVCRILSSDYLR